MAQSTFYVVLPSAFGDLSMVWREIEKGPRVYRIYLSRPEASAEELVRATFAAATPASHSIIVGLGERIQRFFAGEPLSFDLQGVALEVCSEFQRRVILAEHGIPRGWVSTYGRIGRHLGVERGARAVGSALARNPFPIVIPCHRAVRSNGELGGYQGGVEMKRALLEMEGVSVSKGGLVCMDHVYY